MKKNILTAILIAMLVSSSSIWAISEGAVLFLMISPGARAAGMGEAFVAMSDDATASFWNPAGLAFSKTREVTIMHASWLPQLVSDMNIDFLGYRQYIESLNGSIGGNITFLNLGENVWTAENVDATGQPVELGRFNSYDMAFTLSYGTAVSKSTGLGVSMRYIRSMLAPAWVKVGSQQGSGSASAFAVDLGAIHRFSFVRGLAVGANLSNMGPKITYIQASQADPLPTNLKLGLSYKVMDSEFNKLTLVMDTNKQLIYKYWKNVNTGKSIDHDKYRKLDKTAKDEYESKSDPFYKAIFTSWTDGSINDQLDRLDSSIGAEYVYNDMIALRAGYYYDQDGDVKYPAFGAGLKYNLLRFDFAYIAAEQGHPLSDTMRFSLSITF
jgi:hypothetical protein